MQTAAPQIGKQTLDRWHINPSVIFALKKWKFRSTHKFLPEGSEQLHDYLPQTRYNTNVFQPLNGQTLVHPPGTTPLTIERERALASQSSDELQRHQKSSTVQFHSQEILQDSEPWCCKENRRQLPGVRAGRGHPREIEGSGMVLNLTVVSGRVWRGETAHRPHRCRAKPPVS